MTGLEIIKRVQSLQLPAGSYVVFGSGPLALAGIRESQDIDLLVNESVTQKLQTAGWKQIEKTPTMRPFIKGNFEVFHQWVVPGYETTVEQLLKTATVVDGVPFASLAEVRAWKQAMARSKDLADIELIDTYLKRHED